ncbi:MAG: hypothetical protein ACRYG8_30085 [Janthinobacterium lividum]
MDHRLVAWGRAVKARRRSRCPPLWLFTDAGRMGDVVAAVRGLPAGLCGVVFRHDGVAGRAGLLRKVSAVCRRRRLVLVVAGAGGVPAGAGRHLREGRGSGGRTSSAHGRAGLVRARRAGVALVFVSPAFPTASHPGARGLGPVRWGRLTRQAGVCVAALGGVDGASVRRLPRWAVAVGAIGALSA